MPYLHYLIPTPFPTPFPVAWTLRTIVVERTCNAPYPGLVGQTPALVPKTEQTGGRQTEEKNRRTLVGWRWLDPPQLSWALGWVLQY